MSYLLDTHVFLWLLTAPDRVPRSVREQLGAGSSTLYVSAASAMEVATKVRLGKLPQARVLVDTWSTHVVALRATELPITTRHALTAGSLTWAHRDPFDRLLAAQSLLDGVPLVTADEALTTLPGLGLVAW